jgi:hypothetical protein
MPNEFGAMERVAGKVSQVASRVVGWAKSVNWEAPVLFGKENPFKGIKSFTDLNTKYLEIRSQQGEPQLPLINMFYSSQRELIIANFIRILGKIKEEYSDALVKKEELKMTDATIKMSPEQFKKQFPNLKDPKEAVAQPTVQANQDTPEQKAVRDRLKELDNDLKQVLILLGVYKQFAVHTLYLKNKVGFIDSLLSDLSNSLTKQETKTRLYKQEVESGVKLPKVEKGNPQQPQQQPPQQQQQQAQPQVQQSQPQVNRYSPLQPQVNAPRVNDSELTDANIIKIKFKSK